MFIDPGVVSAAASNLSRIAGSLEDAVGAANVPTSILPAAAADEISAAVAELFSGHGQAFQAVSAQAEGFHAQFVQLLASGAGQYASAEAANNPLLAAINAPVFALTGRPLIGDGVNGTTVNGVGTTGGGGGLLWGNGGRGGDSTAVGAKGGGGGAGGWLYGNGGGGGNGGPGYALVDFSDPFHPVIGPVYSPGAGGTGGSALFFGNGGQGGNGGVMPGVPGLPQGSAGGGGDAGVFFGAGGLSGSGFQFGDNKGRDGFFGG